MSFGAELNEPNLLATPGKLSFEGRFPDPTELVRWGGRPGCQYLIVATVNLGEAREGGWEICKDTANFPIVGPIGTCECMVLTKGEPIQGVSGSNGVREWAYDSEISGITGVYLTEEPTAEDLEGQPEMAETPCGQLKKKQGLGAHIARCSEPLCVAARVAREDSGLRAPCGAAVKHQLDLVFHKSNCSDAVCS